ncbi:MAG: adenylate kinase [Eubacteriales bacterium]|nr:adenylate kinase [Eubacteriales bacterium]
MDKINNLVLLGPPGAGKGSVAKLLTESLNLPHISTGAIFREEIKGETDLGKEAQAYMQKGDLVPDSLTNQIVVRRLSKADCQNGFILDGYPRSVEQARVLSELLDDQGRKLRAALLIWADEEVIINRLSKRHLCADCGRDYNLDPAEIEAESLKCACGGELTRRRDDDPTAIRKRLKIYNDNSKPLLDYFEARDLLIKVVNEDDGLQDTVEEILHKLNTK